MGNVISLIDSLASACYERIRPRGNFGLKVRESSSSHKRRGTSFARGGSVTPSDNRAVITSRADGLDGTHSLTISRRGSASSIDQV